MTTTKSKAHIAIGWHASNDLCVVMARRIGRGYRRVAEDISAHHPHPITTSI